MMFTLLYTNNGRKPFRFPQDIATNQLTLFNANPLCQLTHLILGAYDFRLARAPGRI
jgi:hypothetical protein